MQYKIYIDFTRRRVKTFLINLLRLKNTINKENFPHLPELEDENKSSIVLQMNMDCSKYQK
jgi:hypothetical protein